MKKSTRLRSMINSSNLEFLMEAHNGLSAKIVEESGFNGIWGSGLSISASLGVRDNNEASWTQILEVVEFMSDATSIPILLDGDTGYGNFNNLRRLVRKLEQRSVAGVCIEDKVFPKTNSFLRDGKQELADMNEFAGKIKAAKDSQNDEDFVLVARLEAFIAGWGLSEALKRAEAYHAAGADALLVHSKLSHCAEIESFMNEWGDRLPVVIVPTKYYSTPTSKFREMGISTVIWANHSVRAAIAAMQRTCQRIQSEQTLIHVEDHVASVSEIFRLQGDAELEAAEERYLPSGSRNGNVIILAAAQGTLGELTKETPKTLLKINGKSILQHLVDSFESFGISDVTVVRGFAKDKINLPKARYIDNEDYSSTRELWSLNLARDQIKENTIISFGDIYFRKYVLHELLSSDGDISIVADTEYSTGDDYFEYIQTDSTTPINFSDSPVRLVKMSAAIDPSKISGEFIGLFRVTADGAILLKSVLERMSRHPNFKTMRMADLFNELLITKSGTGTIFINTIFVKGAWIDVDTFITLQKAVELSCDTLT